jgi:hypothetical protein
MTKKKKKNSKCRLSAAIFWGKKNLSIYESIQNTLHSLPDKAMQAENF